MEQAKLEKNMNLDSAIENLEAVVHATRPGMELMAKDRRRKLVADMGRLNKIDNRDVFLEALIEISDDTRTRSDENLRILNDNFRKIIDQVAEGRTEFIQDFLGKMKSAMKTDRREKKYPERLAEGISETITASDVDFPEIRKMIIQNATRAGLEDCDAIPEGYTRFLDQVTKLRADMDALSNKNEDNRISMAMLPAIASVGVLATVETMRMIPFSDPVLAEEMGKIHAMAPTHLLQETLQDCVHELEQILGIGQDGMTP